jgi:hypothetical protein
MHRNDDTLVGVDFRWYGFVLIEASPLPRDSAKDFILFCQLFGGFVLDHVKSSSEALTPDAECHGSI